MTIEQFGEIIQQRFNHMKQLYAQEKPKNAWHKGYYLGMVTAFEIAVSMIPVIIREIQKP
jgi:hypothetical protein